MKLHAASGWVVTGHHPDVLTYVAPQDVTEETDLVVGFSGRRNRDRDGRELQVIHAEDRRQ